MSPKNQSKRLKIQEKILKLIQENPKGKKDLVKALSKGLASEKTVQRLLQQMVKEGRIEPEGNARNRVYKIRIAKDQDHSRFLVEPTQQTNDIPEQQTFAAYVPYLERFFNTPYSQRSPVGYEVDRVNNYKPNESKILSNRILKILHSSLSWANSKELGATYDSSVISDFLKQFTFNSARLEGSRFDLAATIDVINNPGKYKDDESKILTINHSRAVDWLLKCIMSPDHEIERDLSLSAKPIQEMHMILMEGLLKDDSEGEIRNHSVEISLSSYIPSTDPDSLEIQLSQIAIKAMMIKDVYERSFFLLLHISYLQAFADGNKRTARLMSNLPLIASKRSPQAFLGIKENEYHSAFVYYYETQDSRPIELLWFEAYMKGTKLFERVREDFKTVNLSKVELNPLRNQAVRSIVKELIDRKNYQDLATKIFNKSTLAKKHDLSFFLSIVLVACDKLAKGRIGHSIYELSEKEIEDWAAEWT